MKRFLLLAVAVLAFVGCNNVFEDKGNSHQMITDLPTLTAAFDEDATRTYVENNKYLRWHEGDLISAFVGDTRNCKYQFEGKTGDNSGTFVSVESSLGSSEKLDRIYALYPYDKSAIITTKGVISCSLSAIQTYATNSFAQNVNTMVSATSGVNDGDIIFKNVGGYLKIRLYGEGAVKSIELRGNNGEKIAGSANITATYGGVPKIAMADDATESIMLDCGDGVELSADAENPTEFWFVVPPTEFSKGITISVTNAYDAVFEKSTSNKIVVERNMIQPMSAVEVEFEEVTKPANNEIWYTATEKVEPYNDNVFGAVYLSSTYDPTSKKGILTFKGDVTKIGERAFEGCRSLTSVTIPDSVTTIGEWAFNDCKSLTSVTIPDSVTTIGEWAFGSCSNLKSITIPDSVTTIGDGAFCDCNSLTSVTIGDSVTTIGEYAFGYCNSLTSVTIGDSVTTIRGHAFSYCNSLTSITIPDSVTTIGDWAFSSCNSLTSITIPDSVTTIGAGAFYDCDSLTSVTIPDSVTTIGAGAFYDCNSLTSVTIGDSVTTIGDNAFYDCAALKELYCKPTTPPTMGGSVFGDAPLEAIYVPTASVDAYKSAYGWRDYADYIIGYDFDNGEIATPKPANNEIWYTSTDGNIVTLNRSNVFGATIVSNTYKDGKGVITFDGAVTTIGDEAFYWRDSLTSITIPDSVTTIGYMAFGYCDSLTSVTIPDSVTTIGDYAFASCLSLTNVTIGGSVTTIGASAFDWCSSLKEFRGKYAADNGRCLIKNNTIIAYAEASGTEYTIPDSVTTIGNNTFYCCESLTNVTIPDSVTTIGNNAFLGCVSLTSVTIPDSVTTIGGYAFYRCESFTSVTIPDSVTTIGNSAFASCYSLASVTIPDSVTTIGYWAFASCYSLASITIPDSVTTIGESAFRDCGSLRSVTIPDSVTTIGYWAFASCNSLISVTIPDSVTTIGVAAFSSCYSLKEFKGKYAADNGRCLIVDNTIIAYAEASGTEYAIPDSVTAIGDSAFFSCDSLTSITIPDSVTTIGDSAFGYCYSLTSVTIPDSVTTIGIEAFYNCAALKEVYCKATTPPSVVIYYDDVWGADVWGAFDNNKANRKIYVPTNSVNAYKTAKYWRDYADAITGFNF